MKIRWLLVAFMCSLILSACANDKIVNKRNEISISQQMTFKEIVQSYSENNQLSYKEAEQILKNHNKNYRMLTLYLEVNSEYQTSIIYYCSTFENGDHWEIQSIDCVQLEKGSKYFNGTIDSWLRSPCQIEYIINGDFYNQASSISPNVINGTFQIDDPITFNITCYDAERFYASIYEAGFITMQ